MDFLPAAEYNEIYEKTQVDVDGRMKLLQDGRRDMVQIVKEYVQFTHGIPDFRTLSPKDQSTLLKGIDSLQNQTFSLILVHLLSGLRWLLHIWLYTLHVWS